MFVLLLHYFEEKGAPLVAQLVKNTSAMWETWIRSLGWEDPVEKGMATYNSILAWKIPWTEKAGRLYSPWNSPGQNRVHSLSLLHRIFPTQGLNPGPPHCRQILYQLS